MHMVASWLSLSCALSLGNRTVFYRTHHLVSRLFGCNILKNYYFYADHFMLDNVMEHQASIFQGKCYAVAGLTVQILKTLHSIVCLSFFSFLQVGFFPSECVELINDKVPQSVTNSVPKPGMFVRFYGAVKLNGEVVFFSCSMFNTSFIHHVILYVLIILYAYHVILCVLIVHTLPLSE